MFNDLATNLKNLKEPTAFNLKTFDQLLDTNIQEAKTILNTESTEWMPLESDPYTKKLRVITLRQIANQNYAKELIKQSLETTATGVDLDHLGFKRDVYRDQGLKPYADFSFKLEEANEADVVIPAGLVMSSSDDRYTSISLLNTTIKAGELEAIVRFELQKNVKETLVKTQSLDTDIPFSLEITQLEHFANGADIETDERYRLRILASNAKYNTAGSLDAYEYFTYTADPRISDVSIPIDDKNVLDVNIYISSDAEITQEILDKVYASCNREFVRPIGDNLSVYACEILYLDLVAEIELFELYEVDLIDAQIKKNFDISFLIGEEFLKIDFEKKMHVTTNVYKVNNSFEDVLATNKQIIKINSLTLNYVKAQL